MKNRDIYIRCAFVSIAVLFLCTITNLPIQAVEAATKEEITLKGIPFDVPNTVDRLMESCISTLKTMTDDIEFAKRQGGWCVKSGSDYPGGFPSIRMAIAYGNLQPARAYPFPVYINTNNDSLYKVVNRGTKSEMLELATLLSVKYGEPSKSEIPVENQLGETFQKEIFVWVDKRGTRITIESIADKIDVGKITIEGPTAASDADAEKLQQKMEQLNNL